MNERQEDSKGEIPLSWFGKTLWKFTPQYAELVFLAICLRLIGLVEPFIFQVIIDRILPFQREASLIENGSAKGCHGSGGIVLLRAE
jgi:subfamily B ATP-binding cassette protein HlyB/CyaB